MKMKSPEFRGFESIGGGLCNKGLDFLNIWWSYARRRACRCTGRVEGSPALFGTCARCLNVKGKVALEEHHHATQISVQWGHPPARARCCRRPGINPSLGGAMPNRSAEAP